MWMNCVVLIFMDWKLLKAYLKMFSTKPRIRGHSLISSSISNAFCMSIDENPQEKITLKKSNRNCCWIHRQIIKFICNHYADGHTVLTWYHSYVILFKNGMPIGIIIHFIPYLCNDYVCTHAMTLGYMYVSFYSHIH